jgi:amidase
MAWLASGSDIGGSLRNPASFCGVVGMRPAPGRVPNGPAANPYATLSVDGPMARDVDDLALFFDALCGHDPREPLSLDSPATPFAEAAARRTKPRRIAWSRDLGVTPVDPEVAAICEAAARQFEAMGVPVEEAQPDLSDAHLVFQTLRAHDFATGLGPLLETNRADMKPELIWNIEKGLALTSAEIGRAERARAAMVAGAATFFDTYDLLLCPATIVPPFPIEDRYVARCEGTEFETYIDWLAIVFAVTNISHPALSLPCGFTASGLPVGLQMVGKARGEAALLSAAGLLEDALALNHLPIDPKVA